MGEAPNKHLLSDGLYRVVTNKLCAGFVIKQGRVKLCAPILKKKINYWQTKAQLVERDVTSSPVSEAQIHDLLAGHGLNLEERNTWWKTPLPELGDKTPAHFFSMDPLAVKLCAKYGCIGDRPRATVLTPNELWPNGQRPQQEYKETSNGRHTVHSGTDDLLSLPPEEATGPPPEPDRVRDKELAPREPDLPDWWN